MSFTPVAGLPNEQGTINQGTMSQRMIYNYPMTASGLSDVPTYTQSRETWEAIHAGAPYLTNNNGAWEAVTEYQVNQNSSPRTTTIKRIDPLTTDEIHLVQYSHNSPGSYLDGLVYKDETKDKQGNVLKSSETTWQQGEYSSARPSVVYVTDRPGQTKRTEFSYGPTNQVAEARDYDYDGLLLRKTVTQYENSSSYTYLHIFNLVKQVDIFASDQTTRVSRTVYTYDGGTLMDTPGVTHHDAAYNPSSPPQQSCYCNYDPGYCEWTCEWIPVYDPATQYRGNVTSTTRYVDAQNLTGAITHTFTYDITGNQRTASTDCCQQSSADYMLATQYAWPETQRAGSATNASHQNETKAAYDFNTGLAMWTRDANNRYSSAEYDANTLRPLVVYAPTVNAVPGQTPPARAYTQHFYYDASLLVIDLTADETGYLAARSDKYLDGLGRVHGENAYGGNVSAWYVDSVVTQFDGLGRTWKQTRPYKAGVDMPQWSEVKYDLLGRPTETTAPDNVSKTYRYYDANAPAPAGASNAKGQTVRVKDQWGRERWARYDAQERLVEVVEPNESGNGTVATNGYVTTYQYDTLGRLTGTTQGSQTRSFKYDSLGRLTHQKLAEREATLDHNGNAGSAWSDYFSYDSRSNLTLRVDARRVRTTYSYYNNALGTDDPLNRLQSVSYDKSQAINSSLIPDAPSVTYSYLTTGNKGRLNTVNVGSGAITDALQYDSEGRLSQATQTFAERSGYPFVTNYLYDKLDRAKEIYYPAQYGDDGLQRKIEPTYDFSTRLTDLKFGGQNFASGIVYNAASQATSVGIGTSAGNPNAPVVTENYTYDQKTGLLTEQVVQQGSTKHLHLQYNYTTNNDPNNNGAKSGQLTGITDVLDGTRNRAYTYDALARLKEVKGGTNAFSSPTWWQSYSYDRYGNRGNVTMGGSPGTIPLDGITGLTYNTASNRITNASYEYDAAGNQTRGQVEGGVFKRFRYDAAGRLAEVRDDGDTTVQEKYTYGASSQRLMATQGSSETVYAWDGGQVVAEYSSATGSSALTWQKGYVYLGGRLLATVTPGGGKQYHHPDRLGTRLMTNADGSFAGRQESLPYGAMIDSSATTNRRFTTYDRSATTKLDYAVNRFYNAAQGRFTQVDPIEHEASGLADPQSLNLYAYCGNDPINHTDPDGLFFKKLFGAIGKIFKAIVIAVFVAGAILLTAGVAVAAFAGWAASAPFFEAFGALMGFFQAHKIIAGIVGIGSAGSFFTPGINGSGAGGVSYFLGGDDEPGLASRFIDWATTDGLQTASDFAAGWGDTLSLGLTRKIRQKMGTDDAVNPCSNAYRAGEIGGTLNSFVAGGASVARGALAMGGRSGTLMQRFGRGAGRFFRDRRKFGTVSRQYWGARNGSGGNHLHHWAIPRRSGGPNAGWNLLDVHGGFNSWMNGTTLPRRAVEWGVRVGIPGTVVGGAVRGGQWGLERDEWRASCASR